MALFALRAIKAGLRTEGEISGFLGLDSTVLRIALHELSENRCIASESDGRYVVLEHGLKVIEEEKEHVPVEETHTVIFDGILRRPVWISGERLMRPSEIDRVSAIEIRPYPASPPEIEELKLPDVVGVLRSQYGAEEFDRDVLSLSRIARRSKVFRQAIGLAYKMPKGPDIQIAFVVDGVPHTELERVFAEKGGARKMGFMKALSEEGIQRAVRRHLGQDIVALFPDETEVQERLQALATAKLELEIAARRGEAERSPGGGSRLEEARSRYSSLVRAIQTYRARPLEVYEAGELLDDALVSASRRLFVAVGDAWDVGINRDMLRRLEGALRRGVEVRILTFVKKGADGNERPKGERLVEVVRLQERYNNLRISSSRRMGFFFLVKDTQFAAIANRPLLGPASRTRMFHQFAGFLLQDPSLVEGYVARLADLYWHDLKQKLPDVGR